jgi:peptidyl-prolyl cis-trans isomerase B (cyclophilin B)
MPQKLQVIIFLLICSAFVGVFFISQQNSLKAMVGLNASITPIQLDGLTPIQPSQTQGQNQEQQQQQTQQQQQQQQQQQVAGVEQGPPAASTSATIKTSKGVIKISLVTKDAPLAIQNFITKVKAGFYTNLNFHRVESWVIQGGDPTGTGTGGGATQTELNTKPFTRGAVGYAASSNMQVGQGARISNDSQFFIVTQDADWLTGQYTNFGTVNEGMDVADKIKVGDKILSITIN